MNTPIWDEGTPGARARYGITGDVSLTADTVAAIINEAVESPAIPGGSILEISLGSKRAVPELDIPPPTGADGDGQPAKGTTVPPEAIQRILVPIQGITEAERGKLLQ